MTAYQKVFDVALLKKGIGLRKNGSSIKSLELLEKGLGMRTKFSVKS